MTSKVRSKIDRIPTATEILKKRFISGKPEREASLQQEIANAQIATLIYDARTQAGLTQEQLAQKIGTHKSAISRLEDSDYDGHSLGMLRRIAEALGLHLEVGFRPIQSAKQPVAPASLTATVHESQLHYGAYARKHHPSRAAEKRAADYRSGKFACDKTKAPTSSRHKSVGKAGSTTKRAAGLAKSKK
jgi:transcriptional regulator with XRE-family HTH domain